MSAWGARREDWQEASETLAAERAGRGPEHFPHALGIDPDGMRQWCLEDAVDTLTTVLGATPTGVARLPIEDVAGALATHTQIGIELGLWLAQNGRVS